MQVVAAKNAFSKISNHQNLDLKKDKTCKMNVMEFQIKKGVSHGSNFKMGPFHHLKTEQAGQIN